jgi:membrane associated rhomboid family serine protease
MSEKPPISQGMRIAGVVSGVLVGALAGGIVLAATGMIAELNNYTGELPSATQGALGGAGIGLVLGLCFPDKLARALAEIIAAIF